MTEKEVLQAALTRLGVDGSSWTHGNMRDGKICAGAAIYRIIHPDENTKVSEGSPEYKQIEDVIHVFSKSIILKIPYEAFHSMLPIGKTIYFNDLPTTTFKDIKETFERAIAS